MVVTTVGGYYWDLVVEVKKAVKYPTRHRTPPQQRIKCPKCQRETLFWNDAVLWGKINFANEHIRKMERQNSGLNSPKT